MARSAESDLAARLVGAEIKRARLEAGMGQARVAELIGASQSYVSNVEAGRENLTLGQLARIADALGSRLEIGLPAVTVELPQITLPDGELVSALR
jgi:transcriptional regulator with XRE-family HTH domain